jgi:alkylation response protein AidB-like acyl-CoA dehydrogenase
MDFELSPEQQALSRTLRAFAARERAEAARWLADREKRCQHGYADELPCERRLRDVIGLRIGDGTAEAMGIVVAREPLGRESLPCRDRAAPPSRPVAAP